MTWSQSRRAWPIVVAVVALAASPRGAFGQQTCAGTFNLSAGNAVTLPGGATIVSLQPPAAKALSKAGAGAWIPSSDDIGTLATALAAGSASLKFTKDDGTLVCEASYQVVPTTGAVPSTTPSAAATMVIRATPGVLGRTFNGAEDCETAGRLWDDEVKRAQGGAFTTIVFLEGASGSGSPCHYNRDYGVVGDPIYVGIFKKEMTWTGAKFEPCALQSAAPNVLQSTDKFPSEVQGGAWALQTFLPRRCFNTAVDVTVTGSAAGTPVSQRYPLAQYDRYRATLQMATLFTTLHDSKFALKRGVADTSQRFIYNQGPTGNGPEYVASVVLYSFLKYIPSLASGLFGDRSRANARSFAGRDIINDTDLADRLGLVLGAGITNPTQRFMVGGSFELLYGVNAVVAYQYARIHELSGVNTTDAYRGNVEDIPTVTTWKTGWSGGISLDLRYVATLFSANRK